jgi:glycosyltransferase involved in cell wall biosynthesis
MRIGLIARCDHTGLGIQSKEFFDHIPCKAFVIDFSEMVSSGSFKKILNPNLDWYPNQTYFKWGKEHNLRGDIPTHIIEEFIKDIDVLFAMETPYDFNIFDMCRQRRIKTVLQLNYEFLDFPSRHLPAPDLFAAPSLWNYDNIPRVKTFLPVPVNTKHFTPSRKLKTFVHIAGRPAAHDRNGTDLFLESLQYVENEITVIVKGQHPVNVPGIKPNINLITDIGSKENYYENYSGGVLVMPRKYGGLCLPMNEAIAAGMPVIAPNISPNNDWLPEEWLVPASHYGGFNSKKRVEVYHTDVVALAKKIDQFSDEGFYNSACDRALEIREQISWENLLPKYEQTFSELK